LVPMVKIGYCATHERFQPLPLLDYGVEAEKAGFDSVWTSDHFHPWAHTNAAGGFAWVWMAALAERTRRVEIGTGVTCPMIRYHPAIVAQAFATLRNMYPDRIFLGLGTGEAMNEAVFEMPWPSFKERAERLEESIKVMKLLWSGSFVNFKGKYYRLRKANLYTKPSTPPPIYVTSFGPKIAEIAGKHADGFMTAGTASPSVDEQNWRNVLLPALERGAKSAGRDPSKIKKAFEIHISYDEDYEKAVKAARFWAGSQLPAMFKYAITDPREIEEHGQMVGDEQVAKAWSASTKPDDFIRLVERYIRMGAQHIYYVSGSPDEIKTIRMFGKHVIPYIRSTYKE